MKKFILIYLSSFFIFCFAQIKKPEVEMKLVVSDDSTGIANLAFGLDPQATDGIDAAFGEEEYPPYPPTGVFDARFIGDDIGLANLLGLGVQKDFRNGSKTFVGKKNHELRFQPGKGKVIRISWNLPQGVTGSLKDMFGGLVVNVSMSGTGSYVVTNPIGINKLFFDVNYSGTIINVEEENLNFDFKLYQNFPNPFNPTTEIAFEIPHLKTSSASTYNSSGNIPVSLKIYDSLGNEIQTLINENLPPGKYSVEWNAKNFSSGVYYYRLSFRDFHETKKMLLNK